MIVRLLVILLAAASLTACASQRDRLARIGAPPELSPVDDPSALNDRQPVLMPMPEPTRVQRSPNSLWADGSRAFFGDPRASRVGDILTVRIEISDRASVSNSSSRSTASDTDVDINALLGLENIPGPLLPGGFDPSNPIDLGSSTSMSGEGDIDRAESIELTVAAVVTQILPNGNFVVAGRQEVRVNHELRQLSVTGVVRPQDISSDNTIQHTQIAEARIAYGGQGILSDAQRPPVAQRVVPVLWPF